MGGRLASERCSFAVCCDSARRIRAIQAGPSKSPLHAQHWVERRGETLTTAREAGTPTRLVRSNALFDGLLVGHEAPVFDVVSFRVPTRLY